MCKGDKCKNIIKQQVIILQHRTGLQRFINNDLNNCSQINLVFGFIIHYFVFYYKESYSEIYSMNSSCSFTTDLRNSLDLFNYIYQPYELVLYTFVVPCIILIGFVGNASFIWTVVRVPSLHTSPFIVLCSLAFTDLMTLIGIGMYEYNVLISPIRSAVLPIVHNVNVGNTIMALTSAF